MRIVVDTNVFVSAALKESSLPAQAVYLIEQRGRLLKSAITEQELLQVMARPQFASLISPQIPIVQPSAFVQILQAKPTQGRKL